MRRLLAICLVLALLVGVALTATFVSADFSDDFEDGVLNTDLWADGGGRRPGPQSGDWSYSITEAEGYVQLRTWGPRSSHSLGAHAWLRTQYNFNDVRSYVINFTWEPKPSAAFHSTGYLIQVTNGHFPETADIYSGADDTAATKNLLWNDRGAFGGRGWWNHYPISGKLAWSITIDPSGVARMYEGPNGIGTPHSEQPLDSDYDWHLRFMVCGATSSGYPAGDARFNLYDFEAKVVPEPCPFDTSDFGPPMGKKKKLGSTLPVKFQLFYDDPDDDPDAGPVEVAGQDQLNAILEANGCEPDSPHIVIQEVDADTVDLPEDDGNVGEGGDLGDSFRYSDGNWIFNLRLPRSVFYSGRAYKVTVKISECVLTPGNDTFEIK